MLGSILGSRSTCWGLFLFLRILIASAIASNWIRCPWDDRVDGRWMDMKKESRPVRSGPVRLDSTISWPYCVCSPGDVICFNSHGHMSSPSSFSRSQPNIDRLDSIRSHSPSARPLLFSPGRPMADDTELIVAAEWVILLPIVKFPLTRTLLELYSSNRREEEKNERTNERQWIFRRSLELTFLDFQIWSIGLGLKLLTETNYSFLLLLLPLKATSNRTAAAASSSLHSCWIFPFNGRSNGSESDQSAFY